MEPAYAYILAPYLRNPTLVMPSLLCCSLARAFALHCLTSAHVQTEFISPHSNRGGNRKKKKEYRMWPDVLVPEQRVDMLSDWFYFSNILVKSPYLSHVLMQQNCCFLTSDLRKAQSRSSLTKERFHVLAGPESFPQSKRSTNKINSFPSDF